MKRRGLTFIEVMIAISLLATILVSMYAILFASEGLYQNEVPLRSAQVYLQRAMDRLNEEIRESSNELLRFSDFSDPEISGPQSLVAFPSARDANGAFQVESSKPVWQKLVIYAPYFNPQMQRGELRRYELEPIPALFLDPKATPVITVEGDEILLNDVPVTRSEGASLLTKLLQFEIKLENGISTANITVQGNAEVLQKTSLLGGARGRN